jgi:hypothetical protein
MLSFAGCVDDRAPDLGSSSSIGRMREAVTSLMANLIEYTPHGKTVS